MLNAVNEMELELAIVFKASKEIHMIKTVAADVNVNSMTIVTTDWHALHTNVWIHVLEFVANRLCAMCQSMCPHVHAHRI